VGEKASSVPNVMNSNDLNSSKVTPVSGKAIYKVGRLILKLSVVVGLSVFLIFSVGPPIKKLREKAKRIHSGNNLKKIWEGIHGYHEKYGHFPPATVFDKDSEPLYSWRVLILPFLGEQALFDEFNLDEAWDSPNNKPLLAKMPLPYVHPTQGRPKEPYATHYQVFTGGGSLFEASPQSQSRTLEELEKAGRIDDTVLVIEAADAVPWTKPQDLTFVSDGPLPGLGGLHADGTYLFLMTDGSVHGTWPGFPEEMIREVILCKPREWSDKPR
jgi:uncharacterized protein DUF1559